MNLHLHIVEYSCALLRVLYSESVRRSVRRGEAPLLSKCRRRTNEVQVQLFTSQQRRAPTITTHGQKLACCAY